jgi:hypothetical protein
MTFRRAVNCIHSANAVRRLTVVDARKFNDSSISYRLLEEIGH